MRALIHTAFFTAALAIPWSALADDAPDAEPEVSAGMMIAGGAIALNSYALSALVGLEMLSYDPAPYSYCANCSSVGPLLLIPIVGPFAAIPSADGTDGKILCALMGSAQVTGLALGIGGIAKFRHQREVQRQWRESHGARGSWGLLPTVAAAERGQPAIPGLLVEVRR
jgi:hypothetical protein